MIESILASIDPGALDAVFDRQSLKGSTIGVCIESMSGEVVYARNPELRLMPASNQKLLSVAYALWKLGPEYVPATRFWKTSSGIVVDAPGDPSMTCDRLLSARAKLGAAPKRKILVRQAYRPGYAPGWEWDDLPDRTAPTISAFSFDGGSFELWGSPQRLWIKPQSFGIKIIHAPWLPKGNRFDLNAKRLVVGGPMPRSTGKMEAFAMPHPDALAAQLLGGQLTATKALPSTAPTLTLRGDPLVKLAKTCLVESDNAIAENLLLMAAGTEGVLPSDAYEEASKRLKRFLVETVGLHPDDVDPYDGSGLSRHNNVTAAGLCKVLRWARKQSWSDVWMQSLATPGSGTLKNRLQNSRFKGKTGTLNKASSLSGYVQCRDGRELVVSIVINQYLGGNTIARDAQDDCIRTLEASQFHDPPPYFGLLEDHVVPHQGDRAADGDRIRRLGVDRHSPRIGPHR